MHHERGMQAMGMMQMCPMASVCKGMANKPGSGLFLMMPGLVLVLAGVLILIEPRALVWLLASASMLIGLVMLFFAMFMRKMVARFTGLGS